MKQSHDQSLEIQLQHLSNRTQLWETKAKDSKAEVDLWASVLEVLVSVDRHGTQKSKDQSWQEWIDEGLGHRGPELPIEMNDPNLSFAQALLAVTSKVGHVQEAHAKAKKTMEAIEKRCDRRQKTQVRKAKRAEEKLEDFKAGQPKKEKEKTLGVATNMDMQTAWGGAGRYTVAYTHWTIPFTSALHSETGHR